MTVAAVPAPTRLLDWTRYARYGKAALREARRVDAEVADLPKWELRDSAKRRADRLRREAAWACAAAARLILVRKGLPVRWSPAR